MENLDKMEQRKKTNLKTIKIFGIVVGSILLLAIFSESNTNDKHSETITEEKIVNIKGIEGMSPVDIYLNLEKKGYTIEKKNVSGEGMFYYCDKNENAIIYNVTMFKNTNDKVEEVKISATLTGQENKKIIAVKPFLKYVSTVAYEGSDSEKVTQWVEDNFNNDGATIVIGKAKFTIHGTKFTKLIIIEQA